MVDDREKLAVQGSLLRRLCVQAHNALVSDAGGYSDVGELIRALGSGFPKLENESPEHLMMSSYAFWGSRKLGGSRRGFERRLKRATNSSLWGLHEYLRKGAYGAWRCVESGDDGSSHWEAIGPARRKEAQVAVVTSGPSLVVECEKGECRAGWFVDFEESAALMFSVQLKEKAVGMLAEAAESKSWHDEEAPEGSKIRVVEYERDVLTQATAPGFGQCGLEPYYYLPATVRSRFPARFRRSLLRTMVDALGSHEIPWHVRLAKAEPAWIEEFVIEKLSTWRKRARRRAQYSYERRVADEHLERVVGDGECLAMLGLDEEGAVDLGGFPPVKLHPVAMLDVDWEWLEELGVKSDALIHGARKQIEERGEADDCRRLEKAVDRHMICLRWCALIESTAIHMEFKGQSLAPGYDELIQAARQVFGTQITDMPLSELLAAHPRMGSRIEAALEKAGYGSRPLKVCDLPEDGLDLRIVRGVGRKSMEAIEKALNQVLAKWPDKLRELASKEAQEARDEIEAGLDELDELF